MDKCKFGFYFGAFVASIIALMISIQTLILFCAVIITFLFDLFLFESKNSAR